MSPEHRSTPVRQSMDMAQKRALQPDVPSRSRRATMGGNLSGAGERQSSPTDLTFPGFRQGRAFEEEDSNLRSVRQPSLDYSDHMHVRTNRWYRWLSKHTRDHSRDALSAYRT